MSEFLILLAVVGAFSIIWYVWRERVGASEQHRIDDSRRIAADATKTGRRSVAAMATPDEAMPPAAQADEAAKGAGLFQDAARTASGLPYERAADQMDELTAELANARRDAERAAERLANRASEALEAVRAAAAAHGGAVPGDGTDRCPLSYPIKGTMMVMQYYLPEDPAYTAAVADVCFQSAAAAEAAGFAESSERARTRGDLLTERDPAVE
jgi:hypothetical protein